MNSFSIRNQAQSHLEMMKTFFSELSLFLWISYIFVPSGRKTREESECCRIWLVTVLLVGMICCVGYLLVFDPIFSIFKLSYSQEVSI